MSRPRSRFSTVVLALLTVVATAAPASSSEWTWSVTPYMWASDLGLDVSIEDREVVGETVDVKDLIESLDFIFQIDVQARRGRHGVALDLSYYDFNDDPTRRPLPDLPGGELVLQGDLEQTILDAAGLFNPRGDGLGFTLFYGLRMLDVDEEIDARVEVSGETVAAERFVASATFFDALVGARYVGKISERWQWDVEADVSAGDTEHTWSGLAAVGYSFGEGRRYTAIGGYRYLEIEVKNEGWRLAIETKQTLSGPFFAFRFGF